MAKLSFSWGCPLADWVAPTPIHPANNKKMELFLFLFLSWLSVARRPIRLQGAELPHSLKDTLSLYIRRTLIISCWVSKVKWIVCVVVSQTEARPTVLLKTTNHLASQTASIRKCPKHCWFIRQLVLSAPDFFTFVSYAPSFSLCQCLLRLPSSPLHWMRLQNTLCNKQ